MGPLLEPSERNVVVQIGVERRRLRPLLGLGAATAAAEIVAIACAAATTAEASARSAFAAIEQHQLAAEFLQDDLGGVAVVAALILPFAGLQLTLDVDLAALAQVIFGDPPEVLVEDRDRMPFGLFL